MIDFPENIPIFLAVETVHRHRWAQPIDHQYICNAMSAHFMDNFCLHVTSRFEGY